MASSNNSPKKKSRPLGKIALIALVLFAAGTAGVGYLNQTSALRGNSSEAAEPASHDHSHAQPAALAAPTDAIFTAQPGDIVYGKADAPVTIIDYSSLSCPHCAAFHQQILPDVKKQLIDTGKAKLVFRHFPLNEPALRAAQLVECAGGEKRKEFLDTLFSMQSNWAFNQTGFRKDLASIAAQGGIDSAAFESCLNDKESEDALLQVRQAATSKGGVNSTPSFFVAGKPLRDFSDAKNFVAAVEAATK